MQVFLKLLKQFGIHSNICCLEGNGNRALNSFDINKTQIGNIRLLVNSLFLNCKHTSNDSNPLRNQISTTNNWLAIDKLIKYREVLLLWHSSSMLINDTAQNSFTTPPCFQLQELGSKYSVNDNNK